MKKSKRIFRSFTLLEIIVAVGIFMVLLGLLLQFFSGARKLMVDSDYKNSLNANARAAMNLMALSLQSIVYEPDVAPLHAGESNDELLLITRYPLKNSDGSGSQYCVRFSLSDNDSDVQEDEGRLLLSFVGPSTNHSHYDYVMGMATKAGDLRAYRTFINNVKDYLDDTDKQEIISGVTDFRVEFIYRMPPGNEDESDNDDDENGEDDGGRRYMSTYVPSVDNSNVEHLPVAAELRLSLMSPQAYEQWKGLGVGTAAADDFRLAHEEVFTRLIYLGDRNLREKE